MSELSLVSEDDLWAEIQKRNCTAIMVTLKTYDSEREACGVYYWGSRFTCRGLAEHLIDTLAMDTFCDDEMEGE